jgi:ribonuclease H / adenosylcobalamin/alpha-ribazole phosphatase
VLVYIIRHGQSYNTHPAPGETDPVNPPLTPVGREEARRLSRRLAPLGLSRIVASPMLRTVETARILASSLGLSAEVQPGIQEFRETAGYPCWGGRELAARFPDLVISPDLDPDDWTYGSETRRSAVTRAEAFLAWLDAEAAARPKARIGVVSHGAITQIILGRVLRAGFEDMERVVIDNTAVSTLRLSAAGTIVLGINDTSHLAGADGLDPLAGYTR